MFLRYARGDEQQLMPALQLVGEGVQGAFEVRDEVVYPAYLGRAAAAAQAQAAPPAVTLTPAMALATAYHAKPVYQFVDELDTLLTQ